MCILIWSITLWNGRRCNTCACIGVAMMVSPSKVQSQWMILLKNEKRKKKETKQNYITSLSSMRCVIVVVILLSFMRIKLEIVHRARVRTIDTGAGEQFIMKSEEKIAHRHRRQWIFRHKWPFFYSGLLTTYDSNATFHICQVIMWSNAWISSFDSIGMGIAVSKGHQSIIIIR